MQAWEQRPSWRMTGLAQLKDAQPQPEPQQVIVPPPTPESEGWVRPKILVNHQGLTVPLTIEPGGEFNGCVLPSDVRYGHCEAAIKSGFPVLVGPGTAIVERPCVLVGSGPSAIPLLSEIRARYERGEEIMAIKGAHDWLVSNGIIPTAAVAMDPQQSRAKCFTPVRGVLYLCASQMHPDTWPHLAGHRALIWHSRIGVEQEKRRGWANAFLIPCASTTGNSAILLFYAIGRRAFELYGFDSSLPEIRSTLQRLMARARGRLLKLDGARVPAGKKVIEAVTGSGKRFATTAELVQQATELMPLLYHCPGIKVNAYGRGYFQALLDEGKAHGWPV